MSLAITLDGVAKTFSNSESPVEALKGVNLNIESGLFVSLVGPSGCGKTTLLNLIAGLDDPTDGYVRINGGSPHEARRTRSFGLVFQSPVLFDWRNVAQNVALPGEMFRDAQVLGRVPDAISLVGLSGFEQAYPRQLSGGMKSRVAIARVITYRPQFLLMDEPFGELDEVTRTKMNFELLRIWHETGATVVFVTHSVVEAVLLSDVVAVMSPRPGRIESVLRIDLPRPRTSATFNIHGFDGLVSTLRAGLLREGR